MWGPRVGPVGRKYWPVCVKIGGVLAAAFAGTFLITILVARGNGTLTANATVFYIMGMLFLLGCAVSALYATKWSIPNAASAFALMAVALLIVTFSFLVADLAVPECENNVVYVWHCTPGEKQDALPLVMLDVAILVFISIFVYAGVAYRRIIVDQTASARRAAVMDDGDGDGVVLSGAAQDGSDGV